MGFVQAITSGFRRYVDFNGRSSRSEYWYWILFYFLVSVAFGVLEQLASLAGGGPNAISHIISLLDNLVDLAFFLPTIAVAVRRLHDTDRSGWWYLIAFTVIGLIPLIIWFCTRGTIGENRFGPDPLATAAPDARPENTFAT
ncbi:MAG TPA: DUF805 domain-containing protein [Caulobacteraceae bacterium]|jgi:uncharacterized membrane protein YhaH (DUF805 family)|nr:DUF805 domain-containing protein [Caulobacteraceae bacterium]